MEYLAEQVKTCTKCGVEKPLVAFTKASSRRDGRNSACAVCTASAQAELRLKNGCRKRGQTSALVIHLNGLILHRQRQNTEWCDISLADQYRKFSFALDQNGCVLKEHVGAYTAFMASVRRGTSKAYAYGTDKVCNTCGVEKPILDFHAESGGALGRSSTCRACRSVRDAVRRNRLKDDVIFRCNKGILKRQKTGTAFCSVSDRERHQPVSQMLDEFGFVKPEFKGAYEGLVRLTDDERKSRNDARVVELEKRAAERREETARRRLEKAREKLLRKPNLFQPEKPCPLDHGATVEDILYQRVRMRIRGYSRKYRVNVPFEFTALRGRTRNEYFIQQFGYSSEELIAHLETTMPAGRSWRDFANGDLHLDHRSPMALFDIRDESQLRNCYALGNLQILRAVENLEKANFCDLTGEYVTPAFSAK